MDETRETPHAFPVTTLIGIFMVTNGLAGIGLVVQRLPALRLSMDTPAVETGPVFWLINGIAVLLYLASIIAGIALLRRITWARRGAVLALTGLLMVGILSAVAGNALEAGWYPQVLVTGLILLFEIVIPLLFLVMPDTRAAWGDANPDGLLAELGQKTERRLPDVVPPVISLIALFFLYTAATYLVIFLMTAIAGFLAAGPPEVPIVFIGAILLLPIFLALLAGIGLLRGADWGHSAALFLAWLAVILGVLSILITPFARQFQLGVYPILLTGIARIVFYVYVIRFIHRYWPKQWVAVTS